ncbi:unnamed protein product [Phyllotreta striolata]|uniref:Major facilitator superfamily (MFS) profile domain-containing protein n=1 Tax=Phyllotreta striolata TaxID=444603 RepID=A0A9N9XRK4_PHYSR|nr:unnamed protein product [Phyllotreta striolata]
MSCESSSITNSRIHLNESYGRNWFVYFCSLTSDLLQASFGFTSSWPSSIIPKLQSNSTEINPLPAPITSLQTSILAALPSISGLVGLLGLAIAPNISDRVGRKSTLVCAAVAVATAYVVLVFAKSISIYFVCLSIIGFSDSVMLTNLAAYNSEISLDRNRGKILCLQGLAAPVGNTIAYFAGFTNTRTIALIGTMLPLLFLCLCYFLPESPVFLVHDEERCRRALETLRGTKEVEMEFLTIKKTIDESKKVTIIDMFKSRPSVKSFLLSQELFTAQVVSGIYTITAFMAPIFNESGYVSGNSIGVIAGGIQILCVFAVSFLVERLGRRPLLLFSSISIILNLLCLGAYFYLIQSGIILTGQYGWVPLLLVVLYYVSYSIGLGPMPFTLMCELFSNNFRKIGITSIMIVCFVQIFLALFSFPLIAEAIGVHYCLWIYCALSTIAFVVICVTMPETKGKCMSEIQDSLAQS